MNLNLVFEILRLADGYGENTNKGGKIVYGGKVVFFCARVTARNEAAAYYFLTVCQQSAL